MSQELRNLQTRLANIESILGSGAASISVDGQTTTFMSASDLRAERDQLKQQIDALLGTPVSKPRFSSFNLTRGV